MEVNERKGNRSDQVIRVDQIQAKTPQASVSGLRDGATRIRFDAHIDAKGLTIGQKIEKLENNPTPGVASRPTHWSETNTIYSQFGE
jgi:hypothetical protein